MINLTFITASGEKIAAKAEAGDNIMETAIENDIEGIVAECGGSMMCATCHVYVDEAFASKLPEREEAETEMLECAATECKPNSRLSCQVEITPELEGMIIHLPETQI